MITFQNLNMYMYAVVTVTGQVGFYWEMCKFRQDHLFDEWLLIGFETNINNYTCSDLYSCAK